MIVSANLWKPVHNIINHSTFICPFELQFWAPIFNGIRASFTSCYSCTIQDTCSKETKEKAIDSCHQKSSIADNHKASYKKKKIWDIYRRRTSDNLEKDIADATDSDDFHAKLLSSWPRWEKLCFGFYNWFLTHRKKEFLQSVISYVN